MSHEEILKCFYYYTPSHCRRHLLPHLPGNSSCAFLIYSDSLSSSYTIINTHITQVWEYVSVPVPHSSHFTSSTSRLFSKLKIRYLFPCWFNILHGASTETTPPYVKATRFRVCWHAFDLAFLCWFVYSITNVTEVKWVCYFATDIIIHLFKTYSHHSQAQALFTSNRGHKPNSAASQCSYFASNWHELTTTHGKITPNRFNYDKVRPNIVNFGQQGFHVKLRYELHILNHYKTSSFLRSRNIFRWLINSLVIKSEFWPQQRNSRFHSILINFNSVYSFTT